MPACESSEAKRGKATAAQVEWAKANDAGAVWAGATLAARPDGAAGEAVLRVPPQLMAGARRGSRERGKSDPIDALAVARAALREPDLPVARLDGPAREVRLLVDHREDLVTERTRVQSRLRWHLHELFPGMEIPLKRLRNEPLLHALDDRLAGITGTVADIARELVARCRTLNHRANDLAHQIGRLVRRLAPTLLALPGCGELSAAKIVGEVAGAGRFRSRAAFARWNGTAPIPVWSSNNTRHRLNRGGNRQVNAALHRIAITQWRGLGPGQAYVQRRVQCGDSKTEALRLLRRRISDEVYRRLLATRAAYRRPPSLIIALLDRGVLKRRPGEPLSVHRGGEGQLSDRSTVPRTAGRLERLQRLAASWSIRRSQANVQVTQQIRTIHERSRGTYGAPRIHAELHVEQPVSRKRVARLMRAAGLAGRPPRRFRGTTTPDPKVQLDDLVQRDFTARGPDQKWFGDITYIRTWEGWLYLAVILDHSPRSLTWDQCSNLALVAPNSNSTTANYGEGSPVGSKC